MLSEQVQGVVPGKLAPLAAEPQLTCDLNKLTAREREIITLFAQGKSCAKVPEAEGIKPPTVRNAIYGIQNKLRKETKQELVVWAVRNGLLDG